MERHGSVPVKFYLQTLEFRVIFTRHCLPLFYFFNQIMCVKWYLVLTYISLIIPDEPDSLHLFVGHLDFHFSNLFILFA